MEGMRKISKLLVRTTSLWAQIGTEDLLMKD
jgi:hypothetical protein